MLHQWHSAQFVAPYTGAWIEITTGDATINTANVAPYTGAWIEIYPRAIAPATIIGRSLHGSVD
ncbi:hypothetical protein [Caproicibacterium sp. XB2]|uniref:hypothetical protein n=1 Tax=Caproicibacterium sp. XB2 TaxID=3388458 RepID=UPI00384E52D9